MLPPYRHQVYALEKGGLLVCPSVLLHHWLCLLNEFRHLGHVIQPVIDLESISLDLDLMLPPLRACLTSDP